MTRTRLGCRGSVLVANLVILLGLVTVFLVVMTFGLSRYGLHVKATNRLVASHLADAGLQRAVGQLEQGLQPNGDWNSRPSPNGGSISHRVSAWGPHWLILASGTYANQEVARTALVGSAMPAALNAAIVVGDERYPLMVAGNTFIQGDVIAGPQGMMPGRIKGEGLTSPEFHQGQTRQLETVSLPGLNTSVLSRYLRESEQRRSTVSVIEHGSAIWSDAAHALPEGCHSLLIENDLVIDDVELVAEDIVSVFVNGSVTISGRSRLGGLLEVVAGRSIFVTDSAIIDEALLKADDSVILARDCRFSGTAIAGQGMFVRGDASTLYPGALLLWPQDGSPDEERRLEVRTEAHCEATLIAGSPDRALAASTTIYLDTGSVLTGAILAYGKADLRGALHGPVATQQFVYTVPPSTYVNWVKSCRVIRDSLVYTPALPVLSAPDVGYGCRILREDGSR